MPLYAECAWRALEQPTTTHKMSRVTRVESCEAPGCDWPARSKVRMCVIGLRISRSWRPVHLKEAVSPHVLALDCWLSSTRVGVWSVFRPAVQTSEIQRSTPDLINGRFTRPNRYDLLQALHGDSSCHEETNLGSYPPQEMYIVDKVGLVTNPELMHPTLCCMSRYFHVAGLGRLLNIVFQKLDRGL